MTTWTNQVLGRVVLKMSKRVGKVKWKVFLEMGGKHTLMRGLIVIRVWKN